MKKNKESLEKLIQAKFGHLEETKKDKRNYKNLSPCGESSPYWDFLGKRGNFNMEKDSPEPVTANPDGIAYESTTFENPKFELVKELWAELTPLQQAVLTLIGFEERTYEYASKQLGVSKGTVQKVMERLKKRFNSVLQNRGFDCI